MAQHPRITKQFPAGYKALSQAQSTLDDSGFDHKIKELVYTRISQINGCAYCLNIHSEEALKAGYSQQQLLLLPTWDETNSFTDQERAALGLSEALTNLPASHHISADLYDQAYKYFSEEEVAQLIIAIGLINVWNRIGVSQALDVGSPSQQDSTAR